VRLSNASWPASSVACRRHMHVGRATAHFTASSAGHRHAQPTCMVSLHLTFQSVVCQGDGSEEHPFKVRPATPWECPCPTEVSRRNSDSAIGSEQLCAEQEAPPQHSDPGSGLQDAAQEAPLEHSDPPDVPAYCEPSPDYTPRSPLGGNGRRSRHESPQSPDHSRPPSSYWEYSPPSPYWYHDYSMLPGYGSQLSYNGSHRSRRPHGGYEAWPSPDRGSRSPSYDGGYGRSRSEPPQYPGYDLRLPSPDRGDRNESHNERQPSPASSPRSQALEPSDASRLQSEAEQPGDSSPRSPPSCGQPRCEARRSPDHPPRSPSTHKRPRRERLSAGDCSPQARPDDGGGERPTVAEGRQLRSHAPQLPAFDGDGGGRPQCGGRLPFNGDPAPPAETPGWRHW